MSCLITIKPFDKASNDQTTASFSGSGVPWIFFSVTFALSFYISFAASFILVMNCFARPLSAKYLLQVLQGP
jgi:hypothetical protein